MPAAQCPAKLHRNVYLPGLVGAVNVTYMLSPGPTMPVWARIDDLNAAGM